MNLADYKLKENEHNFTFKDGQFVKVLNWLNARSWRDVDESFNNYQQNLFRQGYMFRLRK